MTLLERLRIETRPAHDEIEQAIDFERRTTSRESYRDLLIRLYGFHVAWESKAAAVAPDRAFFQSRCKARLLARDLESMGMTPDEIIRLPQCDPLMPLPRPEAVLGSMYVIEGSTLGGAVIAHAVERNLGMTREAGCAYFRSYGRDTAIMWKDFGAVLLAASSPEADDLIVGTAKKTFEVMQDWLCETP